MAFRTFQVIRSVRELPPRDIRVFTLTDPIDIDLVQTEGVLGFDIEVDNQGAGALTVTVNDQDSFTIPANTSKAFSDILLQRFRVSGGTTGVIIVNILSIKLLERINAVEVR